MAAILKSNWISSFFLAQYLVSNQLHSFFITFVAVFIQLNLRKSMKMTESWVQLFQSLKLIEMYHYWRYFL